jgi:two-component system CheB/CheR fusion protein
LSESPDEGDLDVLLTYVHESRGFDFSGYKLASLQRRLRTRMDRLEIANFEDYRDHLEVHPEEFGPLFDTLLINVTGFFRDPEPWEVIANEVVPSILAARPGESQIRVWSAGCASGEEAYTVAMLLAEALGEEGFRARVKIYGTDADDGALAEARQGTYDAARLEDVPGDLRDQYFEPAGDRWAFRKDLKRSIVFGRNNLVHDAPISRIDLLLCRNTLMYFNTETQGQILRRLHYALQPTGFLFLGKSEMLVLRHELFEPFDIKRRIFTKAMRTGAPRRALDVPLDHDVHPWVEAEAVAARALHAEPGPHLLVTRDRTLIVANAAARRLLGVGTADVGRPLQDLQVSYRPIELRRAIDTAFDDARVVDLGPVAHVHDGEELVLEVRVVPLRADGEVDAVSVAFLDVTPRKRAEQELERAQHELATAYEELKSTVEELETTNEELQSTNEELETMNEELQSTNEELETMNEELQSTNEELETMNDELRERSFELREGNAVMDAILRIKGVGIVVIDKDKQVRIWSSESEDMWGLRSDEVTGTGVLDLDIGLPVDRLRGAVAGALNGGGKPATLEVDAIDRRGRSFVCGITIIPLAIDGGSVSAAILVTERRGSQPS